MKASTAENMTTLRWLKPKLVGHVQLAEWSSYGLLRHATFVALRDDKDPAEITREVPLAPAIASVHPPEVT